MMGPSSMSSLLPDPRDGYVDANSFLGEWPSRRVNGSPPPAREALVEQRLALMDRLHITRAAVSLLDGVWLKQSGVANAELHALVGSLADRFLPVYALDPAFPDWQEQLDRCLGDYGLAPGTGGVRLLPGYHGYRLDAIAACVERLADLDVPIVLTIQLEDARMHHPGMRVPDVPPADMAAAIRRTPRARWLVANATHAQVLAIWRALTPPEPGSEGAPARLWFDIARIQGPIDCLRVLRDEVGAERLIFGTNLPLHVPESPIMELADASLPAREDAAIRRENARAALGLEQVPASRVR